ncbi:MAG: single-stranded-DNA-specific exonuclease RecJ [Candidatus Krumholzibacteria bacterium]|nr:single-stranded-DNA-specific exonuclease RecJ [Candidatus Krumholzibacteria bacterium]
MDPRPGKTGAHEAPPEFDNCLGASSPTDDADDRPGSTPGLLSGRPWQADYSVVDEIITQIRREFPLDIQVSDCLLKVLAGRGVTEGKELDRFFYPSLDQLYDPFLLMEMDIAVERMYQAARDGERVAVHGDFDVDGITGSALLFETISALEVDGSRVLPEPAFIPDRATDGYGVAARKIREWAGLGVTLLVTVDTGAAAIEEITLARELGVDVIVLDHHIFDERPPATALVNPRREGATYPNQELCGVAVAFKFAQGLKQRDPSCLADDFLCSVLDLVAMGLVADQMALVGENRILVKKGLERFNDRATIRTGVAALLSVAGLDRGFPVTTGDFAYQLAPRINACGRIGRVMSALELLLTRDPVRAKELAEEADRTNTRRKEQDQLLKEEAINMAVPYVKQGDPGLVLASSGWHKGIIGIGAARLVEQFQLPVVLISVEGTEARGSARSVPNVDVKALLDQCSEHLMRHGGHAQAAGMTLRAGDLDAFRNAFLTALRDGPQSGPVPEKFDLDLNLTAMGARDVARLVDQLEYMEPFGSGNRKPVFRCTGLKLQRPPTYLSGGAHLRFAFRGPSRPAGDDTPALGREFVSFGSGDAWRRMLQEQRLSAADLLEKQWEVLFEISRSTFRPRSGNYDPVQQLLVDIRPAGD